MAIVERVAYAFIGSLLGALVGVACWWLYGLAHSLNYNGPGMDPILRHWVIGVGGAFAVLGFFLRAYVGEFLGDVLNGILHFEVNHPPGSSVRLVVSMVFLTIIIAAIWFTVPT